MKTNEINSLETVRDIFSRALEKTTVGERNAFLDGACGDNPDLRAKVNELLANHLQDSFLERSPVENEPTLAASGLLTESAGSRIDRYKLLQRIGEGGMGVVFMAEQTEPVRRNVAFKIIKLGMDTKSVVARFEAERQALALMDHPNIAKVLDAGATEAGRPYFVMELVKGVPINEYCDKNQLSTKERLQLFTQVCQAIQHAHQKGVIHRDIKPSNILVTLHDGKPVPKVIDFGIAKATNQRLTEKTLFTNFAQMIGTPAYMSPEQAEMSGLDIDTRTDVYSLGVLLYELLTGTTPFPEKELLSKGYGEMQRIIAEQLPERPSLRLSTLAGAQQSVVAKNRSGDLSLLTKQLRGDLDWIIMKSLEKDRTRRYETANSLADDVRRHLNDEPVLAAKPSFSYQLTKLYHRHKPAVAAAASITMALVIGTGVATAQALRAEKAREEAVRAKSEAELAAMTQEELAQEARLQAAEANRQRTKAQRLLYAADMRDAGRAWEDGDLSLAKRLVERQESQADMRGWEWRHLWMRIQGAPREIIAESKGIYPHSVSVSHDGQFVAVGTLAGSDEYIGLQVWDLRNKRPVSEIPFVAQGRVRTAFSPHENLLAFNRRELGKDHVDLWNADARSITASFSIEGECQGLKFGADGKTLFVAVESPDSHITLWDVVANRIKKTIPASGFTSNLGLFESVAVDKLGRYAAYGARSSEGGTVEVLDLGKSEPMMSLPAGRNITSIGISDDGTILATDNDFGINDPILWDLRTGQRLAALPGKSGAVSEFVFWPNGKRLAASCADQAIRIWDISDPKNPILGAVLRGHRSQVTQLALMPDGQTLLSGALGELATWDTELDAQIPAHLHIEAIKSPHWSKGFVFPPESGFLIAIEGNQVVRRSGLKFEKIETLLNIESGYSLASFSENGRYLALGFYDGSFVVRDLESKECAYRNAGAGLVIVVSVMDNGTVILASRSAEGNHYALQTFELSQENPTSSFNLYRGKQPFAAVSPDGDLFVRTNEQGLGAVILDLGNGGSRTPITTAAVWTQARFSPDSSLLAMRSHAQQISGAVHVYDTRTLTEKEVFTTHTPVSSWSLLAFSPDNSRLATGGQDRHGLRLWDVETGQTVISLGKDLPSLDYAQFSPDGKWLGCTARDGLHLWRAPTWEEIEEMEAKEEIASAPGR